MTTALEALQSDLANVLVIPVESNVLVTERHHGAHTIHSIAPAVVQRLQEALTSCSTMLGS